MSRERHGHARVVRDLIIVVASFVAAIVLVRLGVTKSIVSLSQEADIIGSLLTGMFFTSTFTIAPAAIALAEISKSVPVLTVALCGGFGAMLGDLFLFTFMKNDLSKDAEELVSRKSYKRIMGILHLRFFRWLTPLIGALIIASPLPDEIGLAMMGFSRMRTAVFLPISFAMNFIGILIVCTVARSL
jgi:hypothetical protein